MRPSQMSTASITCKDEDLEAGECWIVAAARLAGKLGAHFESPATDILFPANRLARASKPRAEQIKTVINHPGWLEAYEEALRMLNPPGTVEHDAIMARFTDLNGGEPTAAFYAFYRVAIKVVTYEAANKDQMPSVAVTKSILKTVPTPAAIVHQTWVHNVTFDQVEACVNAHRSIDGKLLVGGFLSIEIYMKTPEGPAKEMHAIAFYWDEESGKFLCLDSNHFFALPFKNELEAYSLLMKPTLDSISLIYANAPAFVDMCM